MKRTLLSLSVILVGLIFLMSAFFTYQTYKMTKTMNKANGTVVVNTKKTKCPQFPPSKLATEYLEGLHGIEIGASTQNSYQLKRAINVDFSDEQGGNWQDKACEPAVVNIVALGDDLPFKDGTLDYVLTSHVIEHFFDPAKALKEWHRVIKVGGYIFIVAPHKDRTFDKYREATSVDELIGRHTGKIKIPDYAAPTDVKAIERYFKKTGKSSPESIPSTNTLPQLLIKNNGKAELEEGWKHYEADDHHHWSAWKTDDFVQLVKKLNYNIVEVQDTDDKVGNGFTVVIKK
jgi:ubiquinone/menaquinone biosynthesis C-methylase UbiE